MATEKVLSRSYLLTQLKGYDEKIAGAKYVAKEDGKSLISATDIAQIATNKSGIEGLDNKIGTIPAKVGEVATTTVVAYVDAKADKAVADATYDDTALAGRVTTVEGQITTLNGSESVDGSVAKAVKDGIDDFATKISDDGTINTFKELIDYAAAHTAEYSTLSGEVQANTTAIATLNGADTEAGSVAKAVKDAKDSIETKIGVVPASVGEVTTSTVVAYINAKADQAKAEAITASTVEFETSNIDFDTEW